MTSQEPAWNQSRIQLKCRFQTVRVTYYSHLGRARVPGPGPGRLQGPRPCSRPGPVGVTWNSSASLETSFQVGFQPGTSTGSRLPRAEVCTLGIEESLQEAPAASRRNIFPGRLLFLERGSRMTPHSAIIRTIITPDTRHTNQ